GTLAEVQPLEDVLEALGDREAGLRGRILAIMAEALRNARQTVRAKQMAQQALEIGQRLQDDELCARASSVLALAYIQGLQLREALESWQNALLSARRANDLILQGWPLQRMPLALSLEGRLDEAEAVGLEACELARQTHDWGNSSVALSHLASVAVAKGDFLAAEKYAQETMLMVYRSRYPWGGFRALCALACARALRGTWAEAADALDMLVEPGLVFEEAGPVIRAIARALRQWLRVYSEAAAEPLEPVANDLMRAVGTDTYSLAPLCALVELADLSAAPGIAELPYQALLHAVEQGVLFSSGWMFLLPRVLGVAATLNRRWDTAEVHFQAAIEAAVRAGARPELGRAYVDYARMLAARGGGNDRRQAIELLRQAAPVFQDLGMEPFVRQATQLAGTLRSRVALMPQPHTVSPNDLSEREAVILRQIAHGRSDQEIADDLVLSSQTIAGHLGTIFKKIGVDGRQAAAAYALDQNPAMPSLQTILITDMEGSTALTERLGDAKAYEILRTHNRLIRDALGAHHGFEVTHTGDGIEASFASASYALQCGIAIQQAFARYNQEHPDGPIRVRIGIHAGEPLPTEGRLFGAAVQVAIRICNCARPGQILVSDVIRQLIAGKGFVLTDRGRVTLKGIKGRLRLHQVGWEDEGV
ncbi:MAG: LuxR C-terminal-related transcriptional regulator, partial [Candidatus Entotheonellia bacterium]